MSLSRMPRSIAIRVRRGSASTARRRRCAGLRALRRTRAWIAWAGAYGNGSRGAETKLARDRGALAPVAGRRVRGRGARVPGDRARASPRGARPRGDGGDGGGGAGGGRG